MEVPIRYDAQLRLLKSIGLRDGISVLRALSVMGGRGGRLAETCRRRASRGKRKGASAFPLVSPQGNLQQLYLQQCRESSDADHPSSSVLRAHP